MTAKKVLVWIHLCNKPEEKMFNVSNVLMCIFSCNILFILILIWYLIALFYVTVLYSKIKKITSFIFFLKEVKTHQENILWTKFIRRNFSFGFALDVNLFNGTLKNLWKENEYFYSNNNTHNNNNISILFCVPQMTTSVWKAKKNLLS